MEPGIFCTAVPLLAGVAVLLIRAGNADTRAERFGNVALACGVAGFATAILGASFQKLE